MRKIGNILLLISGILSIVGTVGFIIASIIFFVFASPAYTAQITKMIAEGTINTNIPGTPEAAAAQMQNIFLIIAIIVTVEVAFSIGCAVLAFVARKKENSGLYITNVVLGVLNGQIFAILGGIFGILDPKKNE